MRQRVFSHSMFTCFVHEQGKLVAAGRALADGADCSYICDIAVLPGLRMKTAMALFENQQQQVERGYLGEG